MTNKPESAAVEAVAWWIPNARACQVGSWEEGPGYLKLSEETDGAERKYGTALYPQSALDALRGEVAALEDRCTMFSGAVHVERRRAEAAERRVAELEAEVSKWQGLYQSLELVCEVQERRIERLTKLTKESP